jgi:hypothetical protein
MPVVCRYTVAAAVAILTIAHLTVAHPDRPLLLRSLVTVVSGSQVGIKIPGIEGNQRRTK